MAKITNIDIEKFCISKTLKDYLDKDALSLSNLAHAYLEISRTIYKILVKYHKKRQKLKKGFIILLKLMENIQQKNTLPAERIEIKTINRDRIDANKHQTLTNIEFYTTIMQKLIERRFYSIFSISALAISIVSIILYFFRV